MRHLFTLRRFQSIISALSILSMIVMLVPPIFTLPPIKKAKAATTYVSGTAEGTCTTASNTSCPPFTQLNGRGGDSLMASTVQKHEGNQSYRFYLPGVDESACEEPGWKNCGQSINQQLAVVKPKLQSAYYSYWMYIQEGVNDGGVQFEFKTDNSEPLASDGVSPAWGAGPKIHLSVKNQGDGRKWYLNVRGCNLTGLTGTVVGELNGGDCTWRQPSGTALAAPLQQWHHIEMYLKATVTGGEVKVWQNGQLIYHISHANFNTLTCIDCGNQSFDRQYLHWGVGLYQFTTGAMAYDHMTYLDEVKITDYQVSASLGGTPTPTPTPQTDPITHYTHYTFDDGSGQTATDSAGYNPATLGSTSSADTNDPQWTASSRIGNYALSFDGINDYVATPSILNPSAGDFTASMWVFQDTENTTNKYNALLTQEDGTGTGRIWLARTASNDTANPGKLYTFLGGSTLAATNPMSMGAWHHVAVTKSGSTVALYMDGVLQASATRTIESSTGGIKIGSHKASVNCCYWDGTIDDVRFYNRALSTTEIQTLANPAAPTPTPTPTPAACHLYTPTSTIPSGYGVPWDVFSANEMLIRVTCHPSTSSGQADAALDFGRGISTQYIYNMGYHYHAGLSGWMPMTLTSTESLISGAWYAKTATVTLTGLDLTNTTHYALGYICTWNGSQWKCGCRDSACTQSYWQIQSFKR